MNISTAASIGIIGGADGPTAVFLAGKPDPGLWLPAILGAATLGALVFHCCRRARKGRKNRETD